MDRTGLRKRQWPPILNAKIRSGETFLAGRSDSGYVESGGLPIASQDIDPGAFLHLSELYGSGNLLALESSTGGTIYPKPVIVSSNEEIKTAMEITIQRGRLDGKRIALPAGQSCSKCQRENYRLLGNVSLVSRHIISPFLTSVHWTLASELAILANSPIVNAGASILLYPIIILTIGQGQGLC